MTVADVIRSFCKPVLICICNSPELGEMMQYMYGWKCKNCRGFIGKKDLLDGRVRIEQRPTSSRTS